MHESSTTQIAIAIAASCVVATLLINGVLGLLWHKQFKGGRKVIFVVFRFFCVCGCLLFRSRLLILFRLRNKNIAKMSKHKN